ncbi:MAG TPA: histidine kinase dimerization/phospho-acceptor domain-containing protein, partial [Actinomycetota bacterium]|nr:histidine kinase dimerization/phospho-acceptor domain-containing protein [Actinomycetota bacterium]
DAAVVAARDDDVLSGFQGKAPDVKKLTKFADGFAEPNNSRDLSFVVFFDPEGKTVTSGGSGPAEGERIPPLSNDLLFRLSGLGVVQDVIDRGTDAPSANPDRVGDIVVLAAAAKIEQPGGDVPLGIALVGRFIDQAEMDRLASVTSPAIPSLIVEGKVRASNLPDAVLKRFRVPRTVVREVSLGESVALNQAIGTRSYFNAFAPLLVQGENPLDDTILMLSSPARIVAATRGEVTRILFLVAMGIGVVVLLLAWLSGRRITRPIQSLTAAAGAVREGDLTARAKVAGEDEVGQLGETFNEMTAALLRNTNDLRTAAEEEQRLRARIETIIQSMADGLVAVGPDHMILAFNPRAEELTGIKASKAMGKPIAEIIQVRDSHGTSFSLPINDLAEGSVDGVYLARKLGDAVPVTVDSAVLRAPDGTPVGGVAVFRDMTREREIERMKSEFLSNISHELRTPLTPIKGYAQILGGKEMPPEKTKQFAGGILESTARLERIVELLVDFSALEAGRL